MVEADAPDVHVEFRPDLPLCIRAIGMSVARGPGLVGLPMLGLMGWPVRRFDAGRIGDERSHEWRANVLFR